MRVSQHILNAFLAAHLLVGPGFAGEAELDALFERLAQDELPDWEEVEQEIWEEWSASGSPTIDLLLERGRDAMNDGDMKAAVEHFTALIDHAPEFAEGWNARATAFFGLEEYGLSISDIRQTLVLNPRHFGAMQGLGRILEELEDPENALKAYQAAAALHPHRPGLKESIERVEQIVSGQTL